MENHSADNKRIAKNTFFLYIRMAFSMVVALYTSRVILNALGVDDYGIYGVVGGIVVFFNLISGSLNAAISRFLTFELGKGNFVRLNNVFCTAINIQILMSILFVVLAEIAGVWFLNTHLKIPEGRLYAAHWVLQCSILSFIVGLLSVPYNSTIIAHEHMGAFAYIGILSTFLNLGIALIIVHVPFDKLIFYAFAILGMNTLMRFIYAAYCKRHFEETKWHLILDKALLKEMTNFAGWNFLGASSGLLLGQGVNMLMNVFFGVVVNAARGISSQVDNAVNLLVNNFTIALNPQITKSYAAGDLKYMHDLVCKGAKYSFLIMLIPSLPILMETEIILKIWLKQVPEFTIIFTRLTILISLTSVLSQTLMTAILATGKIKKYQIVISSLSYSIFILAYVAYKMGLPPYTSYLIQLGIFLIQLGVRLVFLHHITSLSIRQYATDVLLKVIIVTSLSLVIPILILLFMQAGLQRLIVVACICIVCTLLFIYNIGLSSVERMWVKNLLQSKYGIRIFS
jgi:O-antigen/teichoic acid export membrane protein